MRNYLRNGGLKLGHILRWSKNLLPSAHHPGVIPEEKYTRQKQDVGHIRVWGCIAYVYIPSEKGGGKLADRGQKGRLMGMEGRGLYRILIRETGQIIRSHNIIFEEGLGHRTLTAEGEYFADDNGDMDYKFLTEETVIQAPQTAVIVQDKTDTPAPEPEVINKPKISHPRIVYPPASRKSALLLRLRLLVLVTLRLWTPVLSTM